ncbi:hypothetical protein Droror1_Dr00015307 [Drosera rotundifolia]
MTTYGVEEKGAGDEHSQLNITHRVNPIEFQLREDIKLKAKIEEAKREIKKMNDARAEIAQEIEFEKMAQVTLRWKQWRYDYYGSISYLRDEKNNLQQCLTELRSVGWKWERAKKVQELKFQLHHGTGGNLRKERQILRELEQAEQGTGATPGIDRENDRWLDITLRNFGSLENIKKRIQEIVMDIKQVRAIRENNDSLIKEKSAIEGRILGLRRKMIQVNERKAAAHKVILECLKHQD